MKKTILLLLIISASVALGQKATPYWRPFSVYVTQTRPADTTSYANNTVLSNSKTQASSNLLKIPGCAFKAGGRGIVTSTTVMCDTPNATNHAIRVRLTNDSVNLPRIADGSPYRLSDSTMSVFVGATNHYFSTSMNGAGSTAVREQVNIPGGYSFVCPAGSTSLYARFEEIGAGNLLYKPKLSGKIGILVEGIQLVVP